MILVTGATGTVGSVLLRALVARGVAVRALAHRGGRAVPDLPGVTTVTADLTDPRAIVEAVEGVERVYLLAPPGPADLHRRMEQTVVEAAAAAGVEHVVKQSVHLAAGAAPVSVMRSHHGCEEMVRVCGVPFTILRGNTFMQNLMAFAPAVRAGAAFELPADGVRISTLDARDLADAAAAVLTSEGHDGLTYELTGPEALSFVEIAATLSEAVGTKVTYVTASEEATRQDLLAGGMPAFAVDEALAHLAYWRTGAGGTVTSAVERLTGRPARTFSAFAAEHADTFRPFVE